MTIIYNSLVHNITLSNELFENIPFAAPQLQVVSAAQVRFQLHTTVTEKVEDAQQKTTTIRTQQSKNTVRRDDHLSGQLISEKERDSLG